MDWKKPLAILLFAALCGACNEGIGRVPLAEPDAGVDPLPAPADTPPPSPLEDGWTGSEDVPPSPLEDGWTGSEDVPPSPLEDLPPSPLEDGWTGSEDVPPSPLEDLPESPGQEVIEEVETEPGCPVAIVKMPAGDEVIPQTILELFGDESYSPNGEIVEWEWSVEQPAGSQSVFVPSASFPNPTFQANVMGQYVITLRVWDETGMECCQPAVATVLVTCSEPIHIELLWHTPNDPDETDTGPEAGADLDLHFLHPWAAGPDLTGDGVPDGIFDLPFDCFWFNAHPNWGSFDPTIGDDPSLDRDDTDGAGPENINLLFPENVTYRIAVHYWSDHGYGPSYATVRVYIMSQLAFEIADVYLEESDLWEVGTIDWPAGTVTPRLDCDTYCITPGYYNPYFFQ